MRNKDDLAAIPSPCGTPVVDRLVDLKVAFAAKGGRIISMTLDSAADEELRNEICVPAACRKMILGIEIKRAKDCHTCGKRMDLENKQ